nr:unnamed protein product [Callosobruchus chinensis]
MEWTIKITFEFINFYENEPALWKSKIDSHKNRNEQRDSWSRIQEKLKSSIGAITIKELKNKRNNLMSTYRKLRSKIKESIKTGSGADEVYMPEWPFYNAMSTFLDDVYNPRKTKNSDVTENERETASQIDIENDEHHEQAENQGEKPFKAPKQPPKKSKMCKVEKKMDEAYKYFKQLTQKPNQDECSLYTELLCKKLRGMQEKTREIAMLEIDKLIFQLKQWEIQGLTSHSQTPITTSGPYQSQHSHYQHQPPSLTFHPPTSQSPSAHVYPPPSSHPSTTFHSLPLSQSSTVHPSLSSPPSPTSQSCSISQPPSPFDASPSSQPTPTIHSSSSSQPSTSHPSPSPQPPTTFDDTDISLQQSPSPFPTPAPQLLPHSSDVLPNSINPSLKEYYELEVQNMFK